MKTIFRLLPLSLAIVLCGCGPGYKFTPWTGPQSNWTTGPEGFTRVIKGIPLYNPGQYPARAYYLIGSITTDNEDNVAKAVKDQHGDAALLSSETEHRTGSVAWAAPGVYGVTPLTAKVITATIIKFR